MKILSKASRPFFFIIAGIVLAFISAALGSPTLALQALTPTPLPTTLPADLTPPPDTRIGSTDGILLAAILIVLVIIIPILWHRHLWMHPPAQKETPR